VDFKNLELSISDLPDFKTVDLQPIQKSYKKIIWINHALTFFVLYGISFFVLNFEEIPNWISIIAFSVISLVFSIKAIEIEKGFPIRKFGVRQHDIIYQYGFFYFSETVVPYNRIQHVEIKQGPLSRLFSLYSLSLYTAGASSGDLIINGLDKQTAQRLKSKVLDKTTLVDEAD